MTPLRFLVSLITKDNDFQMEQAASAKAAATALLSKDSAKPANLKATTLLAWEQALAAVRSRRRGRVTSAQR